MLPKIDTILTFHRHKTKQDNISVTQRKLQCNTGLAVQDNEAHQWWYSSNTASKQFSNTGKFAKMVHADFF